MSWKKIDGVLKQVCVGADGCVAGVNDNDDIFIRDTPTSPWRQLPGKLTYLTCANRAFVAGTNKIGEIFEWRGNDWVQIPGGLQTISIGVDGTLIGTNNVYDIYLFNRAINDWTKLPGKLSQVTCGDINRIYGVNLSQEIFHWDTNVKDWKLVPGKGSHITASYDGNLAVEGTDGNIYQWVHSSGSWGPFDINFKARSFAVGPGNKAVAVNASTNEILVRNMV